MTNNQINYAKLKEDQRSHVAQEQLKGRELSEVERANREKERINWFSARSTDQHYERGDTESQRHNVQWENEYQRSNLANEFLRHLDIQETQRSNMANEAIRDFANKIQAGYLAETERHNVAGEKNWMDERKFQSNQAVGHAILGVADSLLNFAGRQSDMFTKFISPRITGGRR